jgi:Flp pilus assembly protein TadD
LGLAVSNAIGYNNLGYVFSEQGLHTDAESAYREAIRLDPANPAGYEKLGEFLNAMGRRKEANAELRKARRLATGKYPEVS